MFSRLVKQLFEKRGRNGSPQSGKSNAVGTDDEQPPQRRYGDRFKQFDLRITSYRKGCCQATAAFLFREVIKKSYSSVSNGRRQCCEKKMRAIF